MRYIKLFEQFFSKQDVLSWLYSSNILDRNDTMDINGIKKIINYFISQNQSTIQKTALKDCHAVGLNSFILNQYPKVRLFICDEDTEIKKYDISNPIIPIHPHKYDDLFFQIEGKLVHHLYQKSDNGIEFNKYNFIRLNNINMEIKNLGKQKLRYIGQFSNVNKLRSKTLHTVSIEDAPCSWLIIETKEDETFSEVFYHQNLIRRDDLYKPFNNPIEFLIEFVNKL
jgi:hypothetical protein